MVISKQALNLVGVTKEEYVEWCINNNKVSYKRAVVKDFFARINDGRIVRDLHTRKLVNRNSSNKESEGENDENGNN